MAFNTKKNGNGSYNQGVFGGQTNDKKRNMMYSSAPNGRASTKTPGSRTAVQLNTMICNVAEQQGAWGLLNLVSDHLEQMTLANLSTTMHRLARFGKNAKLVQQVVQDARLLALQNRIWQVLNEHEQDGTQVHANSNLPRCWVTICWSLATLRITNRPLLQRIGDLSVANISWYKPFELANLLWTFAKCGVTHQRLYAAAARDVQSRVHDFGLVNLSTVAWSFASSQHKPCSALLKCVSEEFVANKESAESQAISNMVWALATARVVQPNIITALGNAAANQLETFKVQEISNTAWAIAKTGVPHMRFFIALSAKLSNDQGFCWEFHPQGISNILWALAKEAPLMSDPWPCVKAMDAIIPVCRAQLRRLKSQEFSAALLACAKMSLSYGSSTEIEALFAEAALCHSDYDLQHFSPQALSSSFQAFVIASKLSSRGVLLYKSFFELLAQGCERRISEFQPCNLMQIMEPLEGEQWWPCFENLKVAIAQRSLTIGLDKFADGDAAKLARMCGLLTPHDEGDLLVSLNQLVVSKYKEDEHIDEQDRNFEDAGEANDSYDLTPRCAYDRGEQADVSECDSENVFSQPQSLNGMLSASCSRDDECLSTSSQTCMSASGASVSTKSQPGHRSWWSNSDFQDSVCGEVDDYQHSILDEDDESRSVSEYSEYPSSEQSCTPEEWIDGGSRFTFGEGGFAMQHNSAKQQQPVANFWVAQQYQQKVITNSSRTMQATADSVIICTPVYPVSGYPSPNEQIQSWAKNFA